MFGVALRVMTLFGAGTVASSNLGQAFIRALG